MNMKRLKFLILFFPLICVACQSNENEIVSSLKGTTWKLVSIVDSLTDKQTILEPTRL